MIPCYEEGSAGLHKSLASTSFDQAGRAELEADTVSRTAELMRLGQQTLELDSSVAATSSRPPIN